jgi:acyl-CoA synthetase (AMP-forming)/AMP-acid ligase II
LSLADTVRQARASHPEKQALIVGEQHWTYEQFDEITERIGAALLRRGIRPGDRVALHFSNGAEIVFGYYACFKIGAVAVPFNIRLKGVSAGIGRAGVRHEIHQPIRGGRWATLATRTARSPARRSLGNILAGEGIAVPEHLPHAG